MKTYKMVVLINAQDGREDEMNEWFTGTHMPDALKIPGYRSGQRFRLTEPQREGASRQWKYLAIYDIETDDLDGVITELKTRQGTPLMVGTDTLEAGGFAHFFEPITGVMTAE